MCHTYVYNHTHILYIAVYSHIAINMYVHTSVLSSIRHGTLNVVRSKQSHKGRLRQIRQIQYRHSHYSAVKDRKMAGEQIGNKGSNSNKWPHPETTNNQLESRGQIQRAANIEPEVSNILENYNLGQREKVLVIKSITGSEKRYRNIEREALGILYGLEKFHHYCFSREVSIITDHRPLIAIFKKM